MKAIIEIATLGLAVATLHKAVPLVFASLGGFLSERSGVINIGLEGMMLFGAFSGAVVAASSHNGWLGVLTAAVVGGAIGAIHATLTIVLGANQIISGVALNMLAAGGTVFLCQVLVAGERSFSLSIDDRLPHWGPFMPLVYLAFALVFVAWIIVYRTPWGLRLRAVGENPRAADTQGVEVNRIRFLAVITSGILAGIGGVYLPYFSGSFARNMTAGQGFIALAALIFGRWNPIGAMGAAVFFGFADALQESLQGRTSLPTQAFQIVPYVVTIIALSGMIGRSTPPKSLGKHYRRESR